MNMYIYMYIEWWQVFSFSHSPNCFRRCLYYATLYIPYCNCVKKLGPCPIGNFHIMWHFILLEILLQKCDGPDHKCIIEREKALDWQVQKVFSSGRSHLHM